MGAALYLAKTLLPSSRLITLLLILFGFAVYTAFALLFGALRKEDIQPFQKRLQRRRQSKKENRPE